MLGKWNAVLGINDWNVNLIKHNMPTILKLHSCNIKRIRSLKELYLKLFFYYNFTLMTTCEPTNNYELCTRLQNILIFLSLLTDHHSK